MQLEVGSIVEGKVTGITKFGAFVELAPGTTGMVHISEVACAYVKEIRDHVQENQMVKVKILSVSDDGKISLSMKKAVDPPPERERANRPQNNRRPYPPRDVGPRPARSENMSFEDMLAKFKQTSDEKMNDIKRGMDSKRGGFSRRSNNQW